MKLRTLFAVLVAAPVAYLWWTFGPKPRPDDTDWFDI